MLKHWVSDSCLTSCEQFVYDIMARTSNFRWDDDDIHFVLDQQLALVPWENLTLTPNRTWGEHTNNHATTEPVCSVQLSCVHILNYLHVCVS
jgi:hypothetical protein